LVSSESIGFPFRRAPRFWFAKSRLSVEIKGRPNEGMQRTRVSMPLMQGLKVAAFVRAADAQRSAKRSKTMATLEKALDKMREICLSLPDTREGDHFGETAFYVRGKLFATCGAKHGVCEITFGLEPDHAAALFENDSRFKPYSRDKRGVVLDAAKVKSWGEVKELISMSYELVKPPKVKKAAKKTTPGKRTRR
jgi:predicted DNA-binding protein (MmcQ/YjbR family)